MKQRSETESKLITDERWTLHALNIHGIFFEKWCERKFSETNGCKVISTNYPVSYGSNQEVESTLDIRAESTLGDRRLTFIVECKKNNPAFVDWIFFPRSTGNNNGIIIRTLENTPRTDDPSLWDVTNGLKRVPNSIPIAADAREARGTYTQFKGNDKTKTSNSSISEAAYQVTLATQALYVEESNFSEVLGSSSSSPAPHWRQQILIPMIVTTARLFMCNFASEDIDPVSGEIPLEKASLQESTHLVYDYPIPRHLQANRGNLLETLKRGTIEWYVRNHIIVVQSMKLEEFLSDVASGRESWSLQ